MLHAVAEGGCWVAGTVNQLPREKGGAGAAGSGGGGRDVGGEGGKGCELPVSKDVHPAVLKAGAAEG